MDGGATTGEYTPLPTDVQVIQVLVAACVLVDPATVTVVPVFIVGEPVSNAQPVVVLSMATAFAVMVPVQVFVALQVAPQTGSVQVCPLPTHKALPQVQFGVQDGIGAFVGTGVVHGGPQKFSEQLL